MLDQFRRFRRTRPFWAGLFTIAGGIEILLLPLSPVADLVLLGVAGMSGALIGVLLVVMGAFVWFSPPNRTLAGVLTCVFSLASFVVSNLGGLIVGMVLGLIGGGLTLAWTPDKAAARAKRQRGSGPPGGSAAAVALLFGVLPLVLLVAGVGRAEATPAAAEPALPIPAPPVPTPDGSGSGPLLGLPIVPGAPGALLPPVLPRLTRLLPPALFAPLQPTVAPEPNAVVSGLVGELAMDTLTVTNFRYEGMVEFPVAGGGRQRAMRIVLDSTDIGNLRINIPGKHSSTQVGQRKDAPHTRTTRLILDCTRLQVTVAGVLVIEFTLDFPPPPRVLIPLLSVTDVQIDYVRLTTPTLIIPEMKARADDRPGGKRVGSTGTGMNAAGPTALGPRAGSRLSPAQAAKLAELAALLHRPELLRPYGSARL